MGGRGQGFKKNYKNNTTFQYSWLNQKINGADNCIWLQACDNNRFEGQCKVCFTQEGEKWTFKITEGYSAVRKHANGIKHIDALKALNNNILPLSSSQPTVKRL